MDGSAGLGLQWECTFTSFDFSIPLDGAFRRIGPLAGWNLPPDCRIAPRRIAHRIGHAAGWPDGTGQASTTQDDTDDGGNGGMVTDGDGAE